MRIHRVPRGTFATPLTLVTTTGTRDRELPGGLPPMPYRSATPKWVSGNRSAAEPFGSRAIRMEVKSDKANQG